MLKFIALIALSFTTPIFAEDAAKAPAMGETGVPFDLELWLTKKEPAYMVPITVSADGKWLAVSMQGLVTEGSSEASLPREESMFKTVSEDLGGSEIWIIERETGKVTRPFQKFAASYSPTWSPTENKLALAVQDSPTRFPRVATWSPGETDPHIYAEARYRPSQGFTAPTWTPDGARIVFPLITTASAKTPRIVQTVIEAKSDAKAPDAGTAPETLAVLTVATGEIKAFKGFGPFEYTHVWGFRLSPDGQRAAFLAQAEPLQKGVDVNWAKLTIVDLESGAVQSVGAQQMEGWGLGLSWSPDGKHIAWEASPGAETVPEHPESLFIATLGDNPALQEVPLTKQEQGGHLHSVDDVPQAPPIWSQDGSCFWIVGSKGLLTIGSDGQRKPDVSLPAGMGGSEWLENNVFTFAPVASQMLPASGELLVLRKKEMESVNLKATPPVIKSTPGGGGYERAIDWKTNTLFTLNGTGHRGWEVVQTSLADGHSSPLVVLVPGLPSFSCGPIQILAWKLADGTACQGTLLLPVGWKEGDKPPVIMDVYGADTKQGHQSAEALNDASNIINPHLLSARGYAFFKPDMPQTAAEPAASLARAADAAAEALRVSGLVDAERIGVIGQSYGGYTALCALTGSKKFKAGIVANGIYDLTRADTEGAMMSDWVEGGQGLMEATLWEKKQRYIDNSPLYALDKLEAPLLVLQGDADDLSKNQGPALVASLQRLGKPAEYLVGTDMDHVPIAWSIETQRELIPRVLAFLDKNLKASP